MKYELCGIFKHKIKFKNVRGRKKSTILVEHGKDYSEKKDSKFGGSNGNIPKYRRYLNAYRSSKNASCNNDNVDIAFLVDCTRSMRRHVLHTKKNIGSVVKIIRKRFHNHVRLAFVAYRDLTCPKNIQEMDFTKDVSKFTSFADKNC